MGNDELPTIPNAQKTLLGLIIFGEHQPVHETSLIAANDDKSFNDNDRKAARMLYPEGTPPSITSWYLN